MTANDGLHPGAPSVQERITALFEHQQLFRTISDYPHAGIYERFGEERALVLPYIEGEVHRRGRAAKKFIAENASSKPQSKDHDRLQSDLENVMVPLIDSLFLQDLAIESSRTMALYPAPSRNSMDKYRVNAGIKISMRAANGEPCSMYGQRRECVPPNFMTLHDGDLEPLAQLFDDRLVDPFVEYIVGPIWAFWFTITCNPNKRKAAKANPKDVDIGTISAVARAFVCVIAILSLAAPIATLNAIERPTLRIVVMTLFGQVFATLVQFMGTRSIPLYTLITAYFQAMVVFVGTTSGQRIHN